MRALRGGSLACGGLLRERTSSLALRFALVVILFALTGCTRKYWREQADDRSYEALNERFVDPRWTYERTDLTPDPLSRLYDPHPIDSGPLPPDDPAAHKYMHKAYGLSGYSAWHDFGDLDTVENPVWLEPYGGDSEIVSANYNQPASLPEIKKLTLEEALGLAARHSREYQTELENVYLTALALTFERFRFDTQFLGTSGTPPKTSLNYTDRPGQSSNLQLDSRAGVAQFLPTGAQLAAELANNTLWLFSGPNTSNTQTILSYSIVQPLLRNGGRRFAMETLTQNERNVMYAVRDFARYRMGFFTNVVAGSRSTAGVSGVGGGFGATTGGYLGLLQTYQRIQNTRFNIRLQQNQVLVLRAQAETLPDEIGENLPDLPDGLAPDFADTPFKGRVRYDEAKHALFLKGKLTFEEVQQLLALNNDPLFRDAIQELADRSSTGLITSRDVAQIESSLATSRITLNSTVQSYQDDIDRYKLMLGLPTDTPMTIDDSMLKPFELVSQELVDLQDQIQFFARDTGVLDEENPDPAGLKAAAEKLKKLSDDLNQKVLEGLRADFGRAEAILASRPKNVEVDPLSPPPFTTEVDRLLLSRATKDLEFADEKLKRFLTTARKDNIPVGTRKEILSGLNDLRDNYLRIAQGLSRIQVDVRLELIPMNAFRLPLEEAVTIALENRTDLMNQRAFVMDARRKVEVAANQVQALLDVVAQGDLSTRTLGQGNDNPLDLRAVNSNYRVGISFTTPIQLVRERNVYRAALIDYQRARRQYMRSEDQVKFDIRTAWRQLTVLKQNFENSKYSLRVAALQYDQTAEQTLAPARGLGGALGGGGGAGAGNQGLQLLNAFSTILNAQNNLIQIWVSFETNRLNIYRDMGIMVIDEKGIWCDEYYQNRVGRAGGVILPEMREVDSPNIVPPGTQPFAGLPTGPSYDSVPLDPTNPGFPLEFLPLPDGQIQEPDNGLRRRILFPDQPDPVPPAPLPQDRLPEEGPVFPNGVQPAGLSRLSGPPPSAPRRRLPDKSLPDDRPAKERLRLPEPTPGRAKVSESSDER